MSRLRWNFHPWKCLVPALAILALAPATLQAAWLGFRNDLKVPVIVRANTIVNNQARPGKPYLLYPGEVSWDSILQAGSRQVVIVDAKMPKRVLFQETITVIKDSFFSVRLDPPTPPNKIKIVPTKMPPPPKK